MIQRFSAWLGRMRMQRDDARAALQQAQAIDGTHAHDDERGHSHAHADGVAHSHGHAHDHDHDHDHEHDHTHGPA